MGNCFNWLKKSRPDQSQDPLLTDMNEKKGKDKSDTEDDVTERLDKVNSECLFVGSQDNKEEFSQMRKINIDNFTLKKVNKKYPLKPR
jgi:hypothetical protein